MTYLPPARRRPPRFPERVACSVFATAAMCAGIPVGVVLLGVGIGTLAPLLALAGLLVLFASGWTINTALDRLEDGEE